MFSNQKNIIRLENLDAEELLFIKNRYRKNARQFYRSIFYFFIGIILLPLLVVYLYYKYEEIYDSLWQIWMYAQFITGCVFLITFVFGYIQLIMPAKKDFEEGVKVVMEVIIYEKKYMSVNRSYHFFINTKVRTSIEVNEDYFNRFEVKDQLNIEYTPHGEIYLGYF